jgi:glycosyltransferase involved in cell wall biosynthesis
MDLYFFQWISELGGADTRAKDLLKLLSEDNKYNIFVIPNDDFRLKEEENVNFIKECGATPLSWKDIPKKTNGYALAFCNFRLLEEKWRIKKIKDMGLKLIWLNDMMWRSDPEKDAIKNNLIDIHVYTSEIHRQKLSDEFSKKNKEIIIPNFFHEERYSYKNREIKSTFTVGKHSRSDLVKYSDNFPLFYEHLNLENPKYKIMGPGEDFIKKFSWFDFGERWELLKTNEMDTKLFLESLDCYVYNSHYTFIENQSRAIVEAALSGLPIVAPKKYNFPNQIWHERTGFLWDTYEECRYYVKLLEKDLDLRYKLGRNASIFAKEIWCDKKNQINLWEKIIL